MSEVELGFPYEIKFSSDKHIVRSNRITVESTHTTVISLTATTECKGKSERRSKLNLIPQYK